MIVEKMKANTRDGSKRRRKERNKNSLAIKEQNLLLQQNREQSRNKRRQLISDEAINLMKPANEKKKKRKKKSQLLLCLMFRPITRDQRLSFALLRPCILNSLFYAIRNEVEKISRTLLNGVVTSAMLHQQTAASTALTALTSAPYSTSNREPFSSLSSSFVLLDIYSAFTSDVRMQKL